jgi:endonuclease YncB( thermonuclease family)
MALPFFQVIRGSFVIVGFDPDGDSVRFIADDPQLYVTLQRAFTIKPSRRDGSVQTRFEGVDAPELHYGTAAQPLGQQARDTLLPLMGFAAIQFGGATPTSVQAALPAGGVRGAILTKAADPHGRPISYILLDADATDANGQPFADGAAVHVDQALLSRTLNHQIVAGGTAYPLLYTSTPFEHRLEFRRVAAQARNAGLGIWQPDATSDFILETQASIDPNGQLIFPKLFRRCTDFFKAVNRGFSGDLADWLRSTDNSPQPTENDLVVLNDSRPPQAIQVRFSSLISQRNRHVVFQADLLDIAFVEK